MDANSLKAMLPSLQSAKVPREPILITQKWMQKIFPVPIRACMLLASPPYCNRTTSNLILRPCVTAFEVCELLSSPAVVVMCTHTVLYCRGKWLIPLARRETAQIIIRGTPGVEARHLTVDRRRRDRSIKVRNVLYPSCETQYRGGSWLHYCMMS